MFGSYTPVKPTTSPTPKHEIPCPPTPQRAKAIKNLRMIADDLERGYDGFDCFVDYDFAHITEDIEAGKNERTII